MNLWTIFMTSHCSLPLTKQSFWNRDHIHSRYHVIYYLLPPTNTPSPKPNNDTKYTVTTIQRLLTASVQSLNEYTPLCNPISITDYLSFDRWVHATYRKVTKRTINQPLYTILIDRQYDGLYISSLLVNQLKRRARKLDVRLNYVNTTS